MEETQCQVRVFITEDKRDELNKLRIKDKKRQPIETGWYRCDSPAQGIIRMHDVCQSHFKILRQDNYNRREDDPDIEANFEYVKLVRSDIKSFYSHLVKDENQEDKEDN